MRRLLAFVLALNTSYTIAHTLPDVNTFSQQQIFENWVQNRCIGKIADSATLKMMQRQAPQHGWKSVTCLPRISKSRRGY